MDILSQWFKHDKLYCCKNHDYTGDQTDINKLEDCCIQGDMIIYNATLKRELHPFQIGMSFDKIVLNTFKSTISLYKNDIKYRFPAYISTDLQFDWVQDMYENMNF